MDSVVALSVLGILSLLVIIVLVLKSAEPSTRVKTAAQKRDEIMAEYRAKLDIKLRPIASDREAVHAAKAELLQRFSEELAMNVLFDADEKRTMIKELAAYEVSN